MMVASSIAGGIVAVVGLLAGFAVTERIIACPPGAVSGGGSGGLLAGSYSYTCRGGGPSSPGVTDEHQLANAAA